MPYAFSSNRPPEYPRWGLEHKKYQRENYYRVECFQGPIQEIPNFDMRVTVDDTVKDFWGIPVVAISGARHPIDQKHVEFLSARAEEILREAGAKLVWKQGSGHGQTGGQHQAGTCRMGNDPATSVVDKYCRVHDLDNLYIADGSVLVNNGGFNPVLTIMALAFRTGEHIVKQWTEGGQA